MPPGAAAISTDMQPKGEQRHERGLARKVGVPVEDRGKTRSVDKVIIQFAVFSAKTVSARLGSPHIPFAGE